MGPESLDQRNFNASIDQESDLILIYLTLMRGLNLLMGGGDSNEIRSKTWS